jgi:hypothetical protein
MEFVHDLLKQDKKQSFVLWYVIDMMHDLIVHVKVVDHVCKDLAMRLAIIGSKYDRLLRSSLDSVLAKTMAMKNQ